MTLEKLAESLGISRSTLIRWGRRGCPLTRGTAAALKWKRRQDEAEATKTPARVQDAAAVRPLEGRDRLIAAQASLYETKAQLAELQRQLKAGELVVMADVEGLLREWFGPVSEHIRTQPERLAPLLNPADPDHARRILEDERAAIFKKAKELIDESR